MYRFIFTVYLLYCVSLKLVKTKGTSQSQKGTRRSYSLTLQLKYLPVMWLSSTHFSLQKGRWWQALFSGSQKVSPRNIKIKVSKAGRWKSNVPAERAAGCIPAAEALAGWQGDQRQNSQEQGLAAQAVGEAAAAAAVAGLPSRCNQTAAGAEEQQWTGTWWHEGQNRLLMAGGQDSCGWTETQGCPAKKGRGQKSVSFPYTDQSYQRKILHVF